MNLFKNTFFCFILLLTHLGESSAQPSLNPKIKLVVAGACKLDSKDYSGLTIELIKNGEYIDTIQDQAEYKFKLDYKSNYRIVINKPGYQRKILAINTGHVSIKRWNKGFHVFHVDPQLALVNHGRDVDPMKAYPDALIAFDSKIDDFNFLK